MLLRKEKGMQDGCSTACGYQGAKVAIIQGEKKVHLYLQMNWCETYPCYPIVCSQQRECSVGYILLVLKANQTKIWRKTGNWVVVVYNESRLPAKAAVLIFLVCSWTQLECPCAFPPLLYIYFSFHNPKGRVAFEMKFCYDQWCIYIWFYRFFFHLFCVLRHFYTHFFRRFYFRSTFTKNV